MTGPEEPDTESLLQEHYERLIGLVEAMVSSRIPKWVRGKGGGLDPNEVTRLAAQFVEAHVIVDQANEQSAVFR